MPWVPELFSAPVLQQVLDRRRRESLVSVPFFDGLTAGEPDALVESFAGEPELHDPVRGRVRGEAPFRLYLDEMNAWLGQHKAAVEDVARVILEPGGIEEVVLHLDGDDGPVDVPVAVVGQRAPEGLIAELRVYHTRWSLTGKRVIRPPVLQPDPGLRAPDVVADYQAALAAGDVAAIVSTFEPDGYAREPAGGPFTHRRAEGLRAFYEWMFSNGGGLAVENCALLDDGQTCSLEYNVTRWGATQLPPQGGVAVYVREPGGRLSAVRIYDDIDPPLAWPPR